MTAHATENVWMFWEKKIKTSVLKNMIYLEENILENVNVFDYISLLVQTSCDTSDLL